ncbi:MAG: type II secretion system F family protein [Chloroflexi bacterium]|nr:type II secretion system F family protein [Chloroflexota bacterium]
MSPLLFSLLVLVLVAGAFLLLGGTRRQRERELLEQRLGSIAYPTQPTGLQSALSITRQKVYSSIPWLDARLRNLDLADKLARELRRAGVPMQPGEFLLLQLGVAAGAAVAAQFVLSFPGVLWEFLAAAPVAAAGFFAPLLWLRFKRGKRLDTFELALPDALDLVAGSLRAGHGLDHGLDLVAKEMPGPCAEEFGQVLQELNLGQDLEVTLARLVERVGSEDARLLATAVAVQRRTGGNLVEVLSQLSRTIRERQRMRREVRVITTAPRISGYLVGLLPLFTMVAMYFTSRYYVELLFSDPLGRLMALAGGVLAAIGLYINHRIAQVEL